jgi:hypothetical protein
MISFLVLPSARRRRGRGWAGRANTLLCKGCADITYNRGECSWAKADRSGKRWVFVRASKGYRGKLKDVAVLADCCSANSCD